MMLLLTSYVSFILLKLKTTLERETSVRLCESFWEEQKSSRSLQNAKSEYGFTRGGRKTYLIKTGSNDEQAFCSTILDYIFRDAVYTML